MSIIESGAGALDFFEDVRRLGCPDKWLGIVVVAIDVLVNGRNQFLDISKDTSPETMLGQVTEESLHHVQPRRTGGSEVDMESRVALEPALNLGMLMRGVVIHDEM